MNAAATSKSIDCRNCAYTGLRAASSGYLRVKLPQNRSLALLGGVPASSLPSGPSTLSSPCSCTDSPNKAMPRPSSVTWTH